MEFMDTCGMTVIDFKTRFRELLNCEGVDSGLFLRTFRTTIICGIASGSVDFMRPFTLLPPSPIMMQAGLQVAGLWTP